MKRSTFASCLISRMENLFDSFLPWGQGSIFWGTWIVEVVGSGLDWTQFKALLFLRTSSWGNIYAGNSLWSLLAWLWISHPLTVSIHKCFLLGSRVDVWSSTCWTNSWCTWKLRVWDLILESCNGNCSSTLQKDFSKSPLFWGALRV